MNLEHLRHSLAHLLAAAVLKLWPDTKNTIGPAIENGFYYDFKFSQPISDSDLEKIETQMRSILKTWKEFARQEISSEDALEKYKNNEFKQELINQFSGEDKTLTLYTSGEFTDLCRGGHIDDASLINPDAFKLTHIAGAYWRGDEKNPMLTRIYGVAFETKEELEKYLWQQEEAKKRDHRLLGERLDLFTFDQTIGPGLPLWLPKGALLREIIEEKAKEIEKKWGYQRVSTPHIAKEDLFKTSGHIPYYAEDMYPAMQLDDGAYYLKAMNCPMTHLIYKARPHSYRELPLRYAEYGTVYRYELSGTLSGLMRTRGFTQNDAHIYCREDQVVEEFIKVMKLHAYWYDEVFGLKDYYMRLSLPSKDSGKYPDMPEGWHRAVELVREAMEKSGMKYIEGQGEAAFYGPKVDFQIKNVIGKEYTASTNQLDFLATERFGLTYKDSDGKDKNLFVIHRAPLGSHERFIGFLIEHYGGAFPLWLAPVQVKILPIADRHHDYVRKIGEQLDELNIRYEIDFNAESVGKKIRNAELEKVPYIFVVGDKEIEANAVAVRKRGEASSAKTPDGQKGDLGAITINEVLERLLNEIKDLK